MFGYFVIILNSLNVIVLMNFVFFVFLYWVIFVSVVSRKIIFEVGKRLMTFVSCNLLLGFVINGII